MMQLAEEWAREMPHLAFVMPTAPIRGEFSAWFARHRDTRRCIRFEAITKELLDLIWEECRCLNLGLDKVVLFGCSAGALMAGWLEVQLPKACAGLVLLHGRAPDSHVLPAPPNKRVRPPTLVLAGGEDLQIPPSVVADAVEVLKKNGYRDVIYHVEPGHGHDISLNELQLTGEFLKSSLPKAMKRLPGRSRKSWEDPGESPETPSGLGQAPLQDKV